MKEHNVQNTAKVLNQESQMLFSVSMNPKNLTHTEWPKKMYTLFTHQYLWNKFK